VREDRPGLAAAAAVTVGDAQRDGVNLAERMVSAKTGLRQHAPQAQRSRPRGEDFKDGGPGQS
jgi:hypothetical protein